MTDETKKDDPETTAPAQEDAAAASPEISDGGLTLDDSEPEVAAPAEAPAAKPADDIPETSLSLEMDEPEAAPPPIAEDPALAGTDAPAEPVTETPVMADPVMEPPPATPPAEPVFDDAETAAATAEQAISAPTAEELQTAEPAVLSGGNTQDPPPVTEAPQTGIEESFDEFPGDETADFGGSDNGGDDGFGGDDFGDDDGFPSEETMMPVPEKSGSKKKIMMAGGALALAAVIGGGYFVLSSAGDVAPPPKRVAKTAMQETAPVAAGNDFASADTGSNNTAAAEIGLAGLTPPPQPAPLTNTDNLETVFSDRSENGAITVAENTAIPPSDGWNMTDGSGADEDVFADLAIPAGDDANASMADGQSADSESGDISSDYDPSRESVTVTDLDDGALPPPPVETEAEAAPLDFTAAEGSAVQAGAETAAIAETAESAEKDTAPKEGTSAADTEKTAAAKNTVADAAAVSAENDPLTALEQDDPLAENLIQDNDNGFADSAPVAMSELEPPGMLGTTSLTEAPQPDTGAAKKAADPLAEPAVEAAIAPKPLDPLAPVPGEPPPILSGTEQVKEMMPPTKPALTPQEQMRIEQARVALSQGELEGDAIEEHKKTLREVPAKEAMIRPLPKSYLIIQRADGHAGQAIKPQQPQAGTPLATVSTKPDLMAQAIAEQRAGNTAAALQSYEKILSDNPSDLNALTNMLGILRKEHTTLALEKLAELHGLYPQHPGIAAQLAVTHADNKNYREALRYFDLAAALDSPNAYYPFSKGVILDKMGRRGEANSYYQEALTMLERGQTGRQQVPLNALRRRLGIPAY